MGEKTATLDVARQRTEHVRDFMRSTTGNDSGQWWADHLDLALEGKPGGTLKAWMQKHHDQVIDTLQVTIKTVTEDGLADIRMTQLWAPGARRVDAARATRVILDGSEREYAGVTTFVATDQVYVGFAKWGTDAVQMLVYVR